MHKKCLRLYCFSNVGAMANAEACNCSRVIIRYGCNSFILKHYILISDVRSSDKV